MQLGKRYLGVERDVGGIGEEEVERAGSGGSDDEGLPKEERGLERGNARRQGARELVFEGEGV